VSSWQELFIRYTNESKRIEEDAGQVVCVNLIFKEAVVLQYMDSQRTKYSLPCTVTPPPPRPVSIS
jgi:hypothetical protein